MRDKVRLAVSAILAAAGLSAVEGVVALQEPARAPAGRAPTGDEPRGSLVNSIGMRLVRVPAGRFTMGDLEPRGVLARAFPAYEPWRIREETHDPPHPVRIPNPFFIGAHEVTVGQFRRFVAEAGYTTEPERDGTGGWGYSVEAEDIVGRDPRYSWRNPGFPQGDDHPVVNVTWNDAVAFCRWLSEVEGATYRLPTEAEWEYACRAGSVTRYNLGDDPEKLTESAKLFDATARGLYSDPQWGRYALRSSDGFAFTAPVGRFRPNAWGLYDMHGNVWEWCSDWYADDYYAKSPVDDPKGPETGEARCRRGGGLHSFALYVRPCYRNYNTPESRYPNLGLRVVRE